MIIKSDKKEKDYNIINRLLSAEIFITPCICVITGEKVETFDYKYIFLNTNLGLRTFKVWLKKEYQQMSWYDRRNLVQDTLGETINLNNL